MEGKKKKASVKLLMNHHITESHIQMEVPRSYLEQSVEESRALSSFLSRAVGGRVGSGAHRQAVAAYRDPLFLTPAHSGTYVA
jgi:hypothetical protein